MKKIFLLPICLIFSLSSTQIVLAEEDDFDVDQADSLDFEAFHKPKNQGIKLWEQKPSQNTYDKATNANPNTKSAATKRSNNSGKRFVARSQYSSGQASVSINALYQQMLENCPNGWDKKKEWAENDGQQLYLYASFDCR